MEASPALLSQWVNLPEYRGQTGYEAPHSPHTHCLQEVDCSSSLAISGQLKVEALLALHPLLAMSEYWDRAELEASVSPHVRYPLEAACSSSLVMTDYLVAEADLLVEIPADHRPALQSRETEASE